MPNKTVGNKHYDTKGMKENPKEEELEPCVKFVKESWEDWDNHWSPRFEDFNKYYERWIGVPPRRDEDWQSQHHKMLTWQAEKTLVARYHSALFPTSAPIDYDATEVEDALMGIKARSIVAHWFKIGRFSKEFLGALKDAAVYGTGLLEDDWYMKVEEVSEREEVDEPDYRQMVDEGGQALLDEAGNARQTQIGTKKVTRTTDKRRVVEDRYRVRKGNIFAWRFHPNKLDDDDDYGAIKQEFISYEELLTRNAEAEKLGYAAFDHLDEIKEDLTNPKEEEKRKLTKDLNYVDEKDPQIELLTYYGYYSDKKGDKTTEDYEQKRDNSKRKMCVMVANRKYRLKKVPNRFWHKKPPVFRIIWTEDIKPSYYGIGLAQIGASSEDRASKTVNIRTDIKHKTARGGGWYNSLDKKIKKKEVNKNVPGLWRACSDPKNAAVPDPPIPLLPDDYKEEETAVNDHREITGASTSMLPTADKNDQHDTLGGMQLMLGQAITRLKPDLVMIEIMGIRKMANRGFLLTRQFFSKPKAIELIASTDEFDKYQLEKIYQLRPEEITGKVQFFCTGLSETTEKAQNIDKLMKFAEVTAKIPPLQMVTNYEGIAKKIGMYLGFEDLNDFVKINPFDPLAPTPQPGQGMPGQPQGQPGQGGPQGSPQGGPGGLPPEMIRKIQQQMMAGGQGVKPAGIPQGPPRPPGMGGPGPA